ARLLPAHEAGRHGERREIVHEVVRDGAVDAVLDLGIEREAHALSFAAHAERDVVAQALGIEAAEIALAAEVLDRLLHRAPIRATLAGRSGGRDAVDQPD